MAGREITFTQAKNLLKSYYGYAEKDMLSVDIVAAMLKQEDFNVSITSASGAVLADTTFNVEEKYTIKHFDRAITVVNAATNSQAVIGGVNIKGITGAYRKHNFNLELVCYLANLGTSRLDFDAAKTALNYGNKSDQDFARLFDELSILGYLVEPATESGNFTLYLDPSVNTTPVAYKNTKLKAHSRLTTIDKETPAAQ